MSLGKTFKEYKILKFLTAVEASINVEICFVH